MGKDLLKMKIDGSTAIVSVNRAEKLNALNRDIIDVLDDYLDEIESNEKLKCLIIHSPKNFASGADIDAMSKCNFSQARDFVFNEVYDRIAGLEIITIAAMEGYALGGGLELALTCDLRIADENAKVGLPEVTLGIMPGAGGTVRLAKIVGASRAKEMVFSGRIYDAEFAERIGLINMLVPEDESVLEVAQKWAKRYKGIPKTSLVTAKKSIEYGLLKQDKDAIRYEELLWASLFETHDQKEGMSAFLEKRKPEFKDC